MRKLVILIVLIVITTSSIGCTTNTLNDNQEEINILMEKITYLERELQDLNYRQDNMNSNINTLRNILSEQVNILSEKDDDSYVILPIYHLDIYTDEIGIQYFIRMHKDLSIKDKLSLMAEKLSFYAFNNSPLELVKIESFEGKSIAVINLWDILDNTHRYYGYSPSWSTNYLQGSFGGNATVTKLLRTFLQEDYDGKWIDGVKFLFNNEEINNFEHVGEFFGVIHYRKE